MWKYDRKEIWNMVFYLVPLSRVHAFSSWPVHARSFTLRWLNLTFFLIHKSCGHTRLRKVTTVQVFKDSSFGVKSKLWAVPWSRLSNNRAWQASKQGKLKFFHCLIDSSRLEVTAYLLRKDYRGVFEVKNAAQSSGKHRPCVILFRMTSLLEVLT